MKNPLRKLHRKQAIQIQRAIKTKEEVNFSKYSNNRNRQYRNPDFTPRPTFTLQHLYHHYYNKIKITTLPAGNCMFKVNNRNTRTRCEICSKLTITYFTPCSSVSIVNFEQVNAGWARATNPTGYNGRQIKCKICEFIHPPERESIVL